MNIKQNISNKSIGFFVGLTGAVLALVTLFVYIGMGSMYFSALVVLGLVLGILIFAVSELFNIRVVQILSYICYLFALYHFLVLEIDCRMDALVVYGLGGLDGMFVAAVVFFLLAIIVSIVSSCMKQQKD